VETRKNPFQPQTEHTIAAFAISPVEDYNQITWFLARVMQMQVRDRGDRGKTSRARHSKEADTSSLEFRF
jgi:hypothetical protein